MIYLPVDTNTFGFVEREKVKGKRVTNRCGRDFLYYALHYFYPTQFNTTYNNPLEIENKKIFGLPVLSALSFLQIQFYKVPKLLYSLDLRLTINYSPINSFWDFVRCISFPMSPKFEESLEYIKHEVLKGNAVGVDLHIGLAGLLDHVMFVYGFDETNLYIFDTCQIEKLEYEKITSDHRHIMKLPIDVVKKRWGRFARVWVIERN